MRPVKIEDMKDLSSYIYSNDDAEIEDILLCSHENPPILAAGRNCIYYKNPIYGGGHILPFKNCIFKISRYIILGKDMHNVK